MTFSTRHVAAGSVESKASRSHALGGWLAFFVYTKVLGTAYIAVALPIRALEGDWLTAAMLGAALPFSLRGLYLTDRRDVDAPEYWVLYLSILGVIQLIGAFFFGITWLAGAGYSFTWARYWDRSTRVRETFAPRKRAGPTKTSAPPARHPSEERSSGQPARKRPQTTAAQAERAMVSPKREVLLIVLQRAILIAGAIAVLAVIFLTPQVTKVANADRATLREMSADQKFVKTADVRTIGSYLAGVVIATLLLAVAVSPKPRARNRLDILEGRVARLAGDVVALESHITEPGAAPIDGKREQHA